MRLADGIRTVGFKKWYERQLLRSHAHLAASFLCGVGVFAAIEAAIGHGELGPRLLNILAIALLTASGLWSLRRYLALLTHAEFAANQAECAQCKTYGRLELLPGPSTPDGAMVRVRCRRCGHVWSMED